MSDSANAAAVVPASPPQPGPLASRATRVTLFEDRAEVVRSVEVELAAGHRAVEIAGASQLVDDRSLQVKVLEGAVQVVAARLLRRMHVKPAAGREEVAALEQEVRRAQRRVAEAQTARERAGQRLAQATALMDKWVKGVGLVPADGVARWRAAYEALAAEAKAATDAGQAAAEAHDDAVEELGRAQARLSAGRIEQQVRETVVEVQLDAAKAGRAVLALTYRVPCALWRPEHLARLAAEPEARAGKVELVTFATAWQATGERWEDVELVFSTARPARASQAPLLADDLLTSRKKTPREKKVVQVGFTEREVATTGASGGAREVDEMPGVDDGGQPLELRASRRVTLVSDGQPARVELGRVTLDAAVSRVLVPERTPVAHLKAVMTLVGPTPLLAGPVRVARGPSLVGRARMKFVAPGDAFELGFGADDGLRVRREVTDERSTVAVIGTQKLDRKVELFLSNLSDAARTVRVRERVPVSEIADVEIEVRKTDTFQHDAKDGFLDATVTLEPRQTLKLEVGYLVRAKPNVHMPF